MHMRITIFCTKSVQVTGECTRIAGMADGPAALLHSCRCRSVNGMHMGTSLSANVHRCSLNVRCTYFRCHANSVPQHATREIMAGAYKTPACTVVRELAALGVMIHDACNVCAAAIARCKPLLHDRFLRCTAYSLARSKTHLRVVGTPNLLLDLAGGI